MIELRYLRAQMLIKLMIHMGVLFGITCAFVIKILDFKFRCVYNSWHDFLQKFIRFDDAAVFEVWENYYWFHFWDVTKAQALSTMKNTDLKTKKLSTLMEKKSKLFRSFYTEDKEYNRD